jgi:hypothetical protein
MLYVRLYFYGFDDARALYDKQGAGIKAWVPVKRLPPTSLSKSEVLLDKHYIT